MLSGVLSYQCKWIIKDVCYKLLAQNKDRIIIDLSQRFKILANLILSIHIWDFSTRTEAGKSPCCASNNQPASAD